MRFRVSTITLFLLLLAGLSLWQAQTQQIFAQDETPEATASPEVTDPPTSIPPVSVSSSEPTQIIAGQGATLSVFGANFTAQTTVRLVGYGLLPVTFINSGALTAEIPTSAAAGQFTVQVSDPVRGSANSPNQILILAPTATTAPPPAAIPTNAPPTLVPGAPALLVRSYNATPSLVVPGSTFTLAVEVVNQGTRTAQGVSVTLGTGESFFAANGQASVLLPDLAPGGSTVFNLSAAASTSAAAGPNALTLAFSYRDFEGQSYDSTQSLSVTVQETTESSQVTLARYMVDPNPVAPGASVTVTLLLLNSGNETATQTLVSITTGADSVLLPGPEGDSFPIGNIAAGASAGLEIPLRVSATAKSGPQLQQITISYLQGGELKEVTASMTIEVSETQAPAPLFLVASYETGADILHPGDRFTLTVNLQNAGNLDANDVLITFGTVEGSGSDNGTPTGGSPVISSSTTFAPVGAGGTIFIGLIEEGGTVELEQDFVVNGTVTSGIYNLPITLRYTKADGTAAQENLRASIVVIVPPRLRVSIDSPLPEPANVGEPFPLSVTLINFGRADLNLTFASVEVANGEVLEGSESYVGILRAGTENSVEALVMPSEEGTVTLTLTLHYLDDFNQEQSIVETFETEAIMMVMPTEEFPEGFPDGGEIPIDVTPEPSTGEMLGRLILGFLGLGS